MTPPPSPHEPSWTFLSNHSRVLLCLSRHPDATLRQVALEVGITERAVQRIVRDLEDAGILIRQRVGRRNTYKIEANRPLRHPLDAHRNVQALLDLMLTTEEPKG
ncbi:helix-turn-helix transcriptional regulator [Deinococcus alpinitundrae]|uniref:helix-turn-helix transcriptional regulator n=1 Tax=Deinococcus alpinitundrae TaxID=468913 RepID=UPI00137B4FAC|nr:winged helix-turn-helix domain-containing protein [Deinococcus alpinitundrae]